MLHKDTTPPEGTPVAPGDEIAVDITWSVTDWVAPDLHKALDCVYINGHYVDALSGGERPTPNDGHFQYHYVVPADVPPGSTICDQGFVSGPNGSEDYGREISNLVCFPVGPPPPPPPQSPPPQSPPPPECCRQRPPAQEGTTTTTQPYGQEAERIDTQVPPNAPEVPPAPATRPLGTVLPQTGGDPGPARLAAAALGLAVLGRGAARRARRRRSI